MQIAVDYYDNRVHIGETQSNKEYYCPYCGAPLTVRKGDIRQHHFAHKPNRLCTDTWEREGHYDITPWHNDWQACFPKENQEVKLSLGETKHRADVLIDKTVVEFQHSNFSQKSFEDRNNFYLNLGYKVVWLFDLSELVAEGKLHWGEDDDGLVVNWDNPKKAFNSYDIQAGTIELFFQLSEKDNSIVSVTEVSPMGFETFRASFPKSKESFLEHVGVKNGHCPAPDLTVMAANEQYQQFKEKYHIELNKQQERAVQSIEGSVLLLAVPGSGKTTVLVDRLGYMVCERKIDPQSILAITFTNNAASEMQDRYSSLFGRDTGSQITFRTINSLSNGIYTHYCKTIGDKVKSVIEDTDHRSMFARIYRKYHPDEYAAEADLLEMEAGFSYSKNMMYGKEQLAEIDNNHPHFSEMFADYNSELDNQGQMDYDDQMVFAYTILTTNADQLDYWQKKYKYICVDEAQDTSKIQHEIIRLLASGNNLFMVGDEDQSIYGFRAAFPKAFLNFRATYTNPYILRMETNYRSTPQIVEKAQRFIGANKGRYEKNMVAARPDGEPAEVISVASVEEQYNRVLQIAKEAKTETAFLFRDNESSVALVDLFLRNGISFGLKKPEMNFFGIKVVKSIIAHLTLVIDPYNAEALRKACNQGILYLKKPQLDFACNNCQRRHISVYDALEEQMKYLPYNQRNRAENFRAAMESLDGKNTYDAIRSLLELGLKAGDCDQSKIYTLRLLAKQEPDIRKYLSRLMELETRIQSGIHGDKRITLSTIHSSKGLEYDTVYIVDVYDSRFPSSQKNLFSRSKDNSDGEQEERRLFYVGMTRAKNKLGLFSIKNRRSSYIEELFPEIAKESLEEEHREQQARREAQMKAEREAREARERSMMEARRIANEERRRFIEEQQAQWAAERAEAERIRREQEEAEKKAAEMRFNIGLNEVKGRFTQQEGNRQTTGLNAIKKTAERSKWVNRE